MATTEKNEPVDTQAEEVQQEAATQENVSDRKLILGPLAKYGVIALLLVSVIVTTAIMLNKELNTIDAQVAAVEAEIAQRNNDKELDVREVADGIIVAEETPVTEAAVTVEAPVKEAVITEETAATEKATEVAATTETSTEAAAEQTTAVAEPEVTYPTSGFDRTARIAERNAFLAEQDKKHLETFKANQAKQIEMLKQQIARQQERINEIEKRNQEVYEMREATIKRMQEAREQSINRI